MLYGTTEHGGTNANGTVFKLSTNGSGYTILHTFTNGVDGANPYGGLILSGNTLFGTAYFGGSNAYGTIFKMDTDGNNFTNLHSFTYYGSDGAYPAAGLVLSGSTLYGIAHSGGDWGYGTVFKLNTNGSAFSTILACRYFDIGAWSFGDLVLSGQTVYAVTSSGGGGGYGTLFKVNTDGTSYANLHSFMSANDGSTPQGGLVLAGDILYGTTLYSGDASHGTVFAVDTSGAIFSTLHSFEAGSYNSQTILTNSEGASPYSALTLSGNVLYGTTSAGGIYGWGTIFALRLGPDSVPDSVPLTFQMINSVLVLSWTNPVFSLQGASAVDGLYTNIPGATSPYTNSVTGSGMFFRLRAN
jgi:uncharacterized repeat protein (TIGR03803 family)